MNFVKKNKQRRDRELNLYLFLKGVQVQLRQAEWHLDFEDLPDDEREITILPNSLAIF